MVNHVWNHVPLVVVVVVVVVEWMKVPVVLRAIASSNQYECPYYHDLTSQSPAR